MISDSEREFFVETVWDFYRQNGRHDLPWRQSAADGSFDPYAITVSEIMLQQTQVSRVIPKFNAFLERFPTVRDLAMADQGEVLKSWSGLGYNRRARFLHQLARQVIELGAFPADEKALVALPGIGKNTAGAILAYAFNQPAVFIETNIRTVFIHHFFNEKSEVSDKDILELVRQTLPKEGEEQERFAVGEFGFTSKAPMRNPVGVSHYREWYWALMDYGAYLKTTVGNLTKLSKSYARQSAFHGSKRQIRGQVLKLLTNRPQTMPELSATITDERLPLVLQDLLSEGLIRDEQGTFFL